MNTTDWEARLDTLAYKYVGGSGCANCWGDLHQGCESTCRSMEEAERERAEFKQDILEQIQRAEESGRMVELEVLRAHMDAQLDFFTTTVSVSSLRKYLDDRQADIEARTPNEATEARGEEKV